MSFLSQIVRISSVLIENQDFDSNQNTLRIEIQVNAWPGIVFHKIVHIQGSGYDARNNYFRISRQCDICCMRVLTYKANAD